MSVLEVIRLQAETGNMTMEFAEILIHERLNRPPGASGRLVMPFRAGELEVAYQPRPEGVGPAPSRRDAQKEAERRLVFLAKHDALTGLPNRALLCEQIDMAIAVSADFAVMLLDLDHFKLANDTFGHAVGDALLCAVAERLLSHVRESDTVARLGGDEFVVLLTSPCTRERTDLVAAELVRALAETFLVEGHHLRIGASIGVSFVANVRGKAASLDMDKLLHQADTASIAPRRTVAGPIAFTSGRLLRSCSAASRSRRSKRSRKLKSLVSAAEKLRGGGSGVTPAASIARHCAESRRRSRRSA